MTKLTYTPEITVMCFLGLVMKSIGNERGTFAVVLMELTLIVLKLMLTVWICGLYMHTHVCIARTG